MISGGPRPALRRRRKVMLALSLSAALILSALGIDSASASTRSRLVVSSNPDRSNAVRLDGSTVKGKIYVFVRNSNVLDKVDFYLDSSWRTNPPVRTDTNPPFDFAGTAAEGTALPYDTTKLADGSHTIRAVLTWSNGSTSSRRGNFTIANGGATATPTASPTTSTPPSPTLPTPPRRRHQLPPCRQPRLRLQQRQLQHQRRHRPRKHRPPHLRSRVRPRLRVLPRPRLPRRLA